MQNNPEVWEKLVQLGIAVNEGGAFRFLNTQAAIDAYNAAVQPCCRSMPAITTAGSYCP